jgi:PAS domain-containing protein
MKFYPEKLKFYRKKERLSTSEFCKIANIGRTTLWKWENNKKIPTEAHIRMIAHVLNVSVAELSDLEEKQVSENALTGGIVDSWISLADPDEKKRILLEEEFIAKIRQQQHELRQATIVIKSLLSSMQTLFYVKDTNLKYITANAAFLKNLSLTPGYRVSGKDDDEFFPAQEAKTNHNQDEKVLISGIPILEQEGYIAGSRKKKWGLISKLPVLDASGKIAGIVCTAVDITTRKKHEEIRQLLENTLNNSLDVIWLREPPPSNKLIYVSESVASICGYPAADFFENKDFWLDKCVHPEDRGQQKKYRDSKSWPHIRRYRIIKPDGEIRWIESTIFYKDFIDRKCVGCIDRDITEQIKEDEKQKQNEKFWINEEKKRVAEKMKQKGISTELISEITNITEDEIKKL